MKMFKALATAAVLGVPGLVAAQAPVAPTAVPAPEPQSLAEIRTVFYRADG